MNAIPMNVRSAHNEEDEHAACYAELPIAGSPARACGENPFKPRTAPLRADRTLRRTSPLCAGVPAVNDRCWERLFDQLIARVDAIIAARQADQPSESVEETSRSRNTNFGNLSRHRAVDAGDPGDPGNFGNCPGPLCQFREVLDALAESPAARHLDASQDLAEPEWSDSDTAREMQGNRVIR
jgi:hypothetical protein